MKTPDQKRAMRALREWGWTDVTAVGDHYIAATLDWGDGDARLTFWCVPALLRHVDDSSEPADEHCPIHPSRSR